MTFQPPPDVESDWSTIEPWLDRALELEGRDRDRYLDVVCAGRPALRAWIERIIALGDGTGPLEGSPVELTSGPADDSVLGRQYGAFRTVELIGRGGMGNVYLGERADARFEQRVAIKVLRQDRTIDDVVRQRFEEEQRILASLQHPHIAHLIDAGVTHDGEPFIVMEHVQGVPITTHCESMRASLRDRLGLFLDACAAVQHAHRHLVVHRDLKPSNILVDATGEVKLLDFGVSKLLTSVEDGSASPVRALTPEYAAPEQFQGAAPSIASDVYSLGIVFCELLAGERPFATSRGELIPWLQGDVATPRPSDLVSRRAVPAPTLVHRLRGDLDAIAGRALQRDPSRRYVDVEQMAANVRRYLEGRVVHASPATTATHVRKWILRNRTLSVAITVAATALAALVIGVGNAARVARMERDRAIASGRILTSLYSEITDRAGQTGSIPLDTLLTIGAARVSTDSLLDPSLRASMLASLGRALGMNGQSTEALPYLRTAVASTVPLTRGDSARFIRTLWSYGDALYYQHRYALAESVYTVSLAFSEALGLPRSVASSHASLSQSQRGRGDLAAAEASARKAVAMLASSPLESPVQLYHALSRLGHTALARGNAVVADSAYRSAAEWAKVGLGSEHPEYGEVLINLGVARARLGDRRGLDSLTRLGIRLQDLAYGAGHEAVLTNRRNWAVALGSLGEDVRADSILSAVVAQFRERRAADSLGLFLALGELAAVRQRRFGCEAGAQLEVEISGLRTALHGPSLRGGVDSALRRCANR